MDTQQKVNFVCRLKKNAVYAVEQVMYEIALPEREAGVLKDEHIHLDYHENKVNKKLCLRKVTYRDEKGRLYQFITNNFEIAAQEVALLYKLRWNIELLFKKLKQNFQLHYFYSESENGIKTQIWLYLNRSIASALAKSSFQKQKGIFYYSSVD